MILPLVVDVNQQLSENFGIVQQTAFFFKRLKGFLKNNLSALLTCYWDSKPHAKACYTAVSYQKQKLSILACIIKTEQQKDEGIVEERPKSSSAVSYHKQSWATRLYPAQNNLTKVRWGVNLQTAKNCNWATPQAKALFESKYCKLSKFQLSWHSTHLNFILSLHLAVSCNQGEIDQTMLIIQFVVKNIFVLLIYKIRVYKILAD